MSIVQHENKAHERTCNLSEGTRQNAVAAAISAGGSTVGAAVKTAEIAHYRRIIASCMDNGLPFSNFTQALKGFGNGRHLKRTMQMKARRSIQNYAATLGLMLVFLPGPPTRAAVFNSPDRVVYSNQAAGTLGPFTLRGGSYWIETKSTGSGTIDLKRLGPDGATYTARITQITATAGQQTISLPSGSYQWVVATFTANYLEITRIPTAVE